MIARATIISILLTFSLLSQKKNDVWCAVVRLDGLLVPLSTFDGSHWNMPGLSGFQIPFGVPEDWYFWPVTGPKSMIGRGTPVMFERPGDPPGVAFLTDFCPQTTRTDVYPYPKAGIAFGQQVLFQQMLPTDTSQPSAKRLIARLLKIFNRREVTDSSKAISFLGYLPSAQKRKEASVTIQFLGETSGYSNAHECFYYFEFIKHYPAKDCGPTSMYKGWVHQTQGDSSCFNDDISFGDCDKGTASAARPYGSVLLNGRLFFVLEIIPYEGETWSILEWRDKRLVDVTPAMN